MNRVMIVTSKDGMIRDVVATDAVILPKWLKKMVRRDIESGKDVSIYHNVPDDNFGALPLAVSLS